MDEDELERRRQLFLRVLPEWEGRIFNVSNNTLQTRTIDTKYDVEDICNQLRWAVYQAVLSWREDKGATLSTWIYRAINNERGLFIEKNYNKVQRDEEGNPLYNYSLDKEVDEMPFQIEDAYSIDSLLSFIDEEWFQDLMIKIRKVLSEGFNQQVFDMIVSRKYESDADIAKELDVDFARVSEIRLKVKIAFAILNDIPIDSFTNAQNSITIERTLRKKLS